MHFPFTFVLAAAAPPASTWDQLKAVPQDTWINLAICLLALVVIVRLWRALKKFNDYAPYFAVVVASLLIFFYWVYDRSEPRFLTPVIDRIAPFFPSKGKQQQIQEKRQRGREV